MIRIVGGPRDGYVLSEEQYLGFLRQRGERGEPQEGEEVVLRGTESGEIQRYVVRGDEYHFVEVIVAIVFKGGPMDGHQQPISAKHAVVKEGEFAVFPLPKEEGQERRYAWYKREGNFYIYDKTCLGSDMRKVEDDN